MEINPPRRKFLGRVLLATAGMTFMPSKSVAKVFDNTNVPFEGYNPYVEEKNDLRTSLLGKQVAIKGIIYDASGQHPVPNAVVEIWHLSPNSTKYHHRGKVYTNAVGEYNFITNWPERANGSMPRVYYKVSNEGKTAFTELLFNDYGANITSKHWENNNQLGDQLLFPTYTIFLNKANIKFNIVLTKI